MNSFNVGDVVRFKHGKGVKSGLHEITDVYSDKVYQYTVTNDECDSEYYAKHDDLIFVCSAENREDI